MKAQTRLGRLVHSPMSRRRPLPPYDYPAGAHFGSDGSDGGADPVVIVQTDNMLSRSDHSRVTRHRQ
jgi:hypothetical protein